MIQAMPSYKTIAIWTSLALSWGLSISLTFLVWDTAPAALGVFVQFAAAALALGLAFGRFAYGILNDLIADWGDGHKREMILTIAAGLALAFSFLLMIIKRYGFAPAGSDIVFLLATCPIFVIAIVYAMKAERVTFGIIAGSGAALLGAMAIVGNWERPSSFSPFVKFPAEEALLLLSAALFAVFIVLFWRLSRKRSASGLVTLTVWMALPVLLLMVRVFNGWAVFSTIGLSEYSVLAVAGVLGVALPLFLLSKLAGRVDATKASTAIYLSPVIMTLLIVAEKLSGATGAGIMPTPFLWAPVLAGSAIVITGVVAAWIG